MPDIGINLPEEELLLYVVGETHNELPIMLFDIAVEVEAIRDIVVERINNDRDSIIRVIRFLQSLLDDIDDVLDGFGS